MPPDMLFQDYQKHDYVDTTGRKDLKKDSKSTIVSHSEWICNMPPEGHLKIERHSQSATLHMSPSSETLLPVHQEEIMDAPVTTEGGFNNHASTSKRLRITTQQTAFPSYVTSSSVELRESVELQNNFRNAGHPSTQRLLGHSMLYNPLDEPSPLGLTLRKTPSLLDLIQMKLSYSDRTLSGGCGAKTPEIASRGRESSGPLITQQEKLKASNFPASILKIGRWECVSRYEGDLVVKCYYAKKKLVWEVLENGLKSKFEIQWSDITALRATYSDNEPGILEIKVSRPPLFFKETNPQPRKHTLWEATTDFTGGQATICKWHYLKISPGLLNRHYEKLVECDPYLKSLSEKATSCGKYYPEPHGVNADLQHDQKDCQLTQQNEIHYIRFGSEHLPPYLKLHTVFGTSESRDTRIVPKYEPVETENGIHYRMMEITSSPSTSSDIDVEGPSHMPFLNLSCPGICLEGHEGSNPTCNREGFEFLEHVPGIHGADCSGYQEIVNNSSKAINAERSLRDPSFDSRDDNRQRLVELGCHLGEALSPPFHEQRIAPRLTVAPSQIDGNNLSDSLVSNVPPKKSSQAEPDLALPFEGIITSECGVMNDGKTSDRSLPPEEMPQSSFEPSLFNISKHESYEDLLCNIPRIASLPQFFEPALLRSADCKFEAKCTDSDFK